MLGLLFAALAPPATPAPVSVEQAAYHRLVVATPDYALLDVVIPPGASPGFHRHPRALFYTVIEPALIGVQNRGEALRQIAPTDVGSVGMNPIADEPRIHDVHNLDTHPYHVIGIEIRRAKPLGAALTERGADTRFVMIADNPRIRAWRLILQPGEAAQMMKQVGTGLRIFVRGNAMTTIRASRPPQHQIISAGLFEQLVPGDSRGLVNEGPTPIELVDVELK